MPLSANLFRLESSILTRAKRATNRNKVGYRKTKLKNNYFFIFFREDFGRRDFIQELFITNASLLYGRRNPVAGAGDVAS